MPLNSTKELHKQKEPEVISNTINEPVIKKEASKFLKFIKHSEYNMVEQLNKLPSRISLLPLLMNSEPHLKALMKVLSEAYVAHNISMEKVHQLRVISSLAI